MSISVSFKLDKLNKQQKNPKNIRMKLLINLVICFLGFFLVFSTFSDNAIKLYEKYFVNDHHEILIYIERIDQYNSDSTEIVDNIRLKLYRTDQGEYSNDIKKAKDDLQQLINKVDALTAPQGFGHHKDLYLAVLNQRMLVLTTYDNTKKTYVFEKLKTSVSKLNHKRYMERKTLLKAFKNAGINYKKLGDGSIRYWYKSQFGKSLKGSI